MAQVIVWRLEDKHGNGIYRGGEYFYEAAGDDPNWNTPTRHPSPVYDRALGFQEIINDDDYSFGFASLAQMRQWVYRSKWRKSLTEQGVLLNKYSVDTEYFRKSPFQAVFDKRHATLVETRKPDYAG